MTGAQQGLTGLLTERAGLLSGGVAMSSLPPGVTESPSGFTDYWFHPWNGSVLTPAGPWLAVFS